MGEAFLVKYEVFTSYKGNICSNYSVETVNDGGILNRTRNCNYLALVTFSTIRNDNITVTFSLKPNGSGGSSVIRNFSIPATFYVYQGQQRTFYSTDSEYYFFIDFVTYSNMIHFDFRKGNDSYLGYYMLSTYSSSIELSYMFL